ncbi:MAG: hypothetical protein ABSD31_05975 [Candidatus Binataceae bacterium]|jgi:hypothetical protein
MAEEVNINVGERSNQDLALDLLKFVVARTTSSSNRWNSEEEILELYARCKSAVSTPAKINR